MSSYAITACLAARAWGYETPISTQGTTTSTTELIANVNGLPARRRSGEWVNRHPEDRHLVTATSGDTPAMMERWIGSRQDSAKASLATVSEYEVSQRPR